MESKPIQFRLTPEDTARIERIRARYGLQTSAAAVRYALAIADPSAESSRKSAKKSKEGY